MISGAKKKIVVQIKFIYFRKEYIIKHWKYSKKKQQIYLS